jgi:hypothetical protein
LNRFDNFSKVVKSHPPEIDWSRGYEFLDQELQKVVRDATSKQRRVDKLVKVWLKNGQAALLYIHVEVQSQVEDDFNKRMFIYHYRLYDRYQQPILSLAILGDDREDWRPDGFGYEVLGCYISFYFPTVKLLDYQEKLEELKPSRNPFAIVGLTHLKGLETRQLPAQRFYWKQEIFKALPEAGFSEAEIVDLYHFLDWVLALPAELTKQFDEFVTAYEEGKKMKYVTTLERSSIQKGLSQGILERSREAVLEILALRFAEIPETLVAKIKALEDVSWLSDLLKKAVLVTSLEEFAQLLG